MSEPQAEAKSILETKDKLTEVLPHASEQQKPVSAVEKFVAAGFENVSRLQGGLAGWKAISGPTEGRVG